MEENGAAMVFEMNELYARAIDSIELEIEDWRGYFGGAFGEHEDELRKIIAPLELKRDALKELYKNDTGEDYKRVLFIDRVKPELSPNPHIPEVERSTYEGEMKMNQKVLNAIATAAADFHVIGDDETPVKIMRGLEFFTLVSQFPHSTFEEARSLYIGMRDRTLMELPQRRYPDEAQQCLNSLHVRLRWLLEGAAMLSTCCEVLADYWGLYDEPR